MGWREDVELALRNLGGEADLSSIYGEISKIKNGNVGPNADAGVRRTLETFSSDSEVWTPGNPDLFKRVANGRWSLRPPQTPRVDAVMNEITKEDILAAIEKLRSGTPHNFGNSVRYDVLFEGQRFPPKAVIGFAAQRQMGRPLDPDEFSGGVGTKCFQILKAQGFEIVEKDKKVKTAQGSLAEQFEAILAEYGNARKKAFGGEHAINSKFLTAKSLLTSSEAVRRFPNIAVQYSTGQGNWAKVPWIAFLDKRETTSTQRGVYSLANSMPSIVTFISRTSASMGRT